MSQRCLYFAFVFTCAAVPALRAQSFGYQTFPVPNAAPATPQSLGVQTIDDQGTIVGWLVDTSSNQKSFIRNPGGEISEFIDPLNTSTPSFTLTYGLNDLGTAVGIFTDNSAGDYPGFLYNNGKFTTFNLPDQPAGTATYLEALNNLGDYCGAVATPANNYNDQTFLSIAGKVQIFAVNGAVNSLCTGINDLQVAVGYYFDAAGLAHGWKRDPLTGSISVIDVPGAVKVVGAAPCWGTSFGGTEIFGINDLGEITGHYWDASYKSHGFALSADGTFHTLDVPGAYQTGGGGLNNSGVIVGHYSDRNCNNYAYIATPFGFF